MIRSILGAIAGLATAVLLIQLTEMLGHAIYPPPAEIELGDAKQMRAFMSTLPVGAILFVGLAWVIGAFGGTLVGAMIATAKPVIYAVIVGGLVLAGSISMLIIIPHPWWFTATAPFAVVLAAYAAMRLVPRPTAEGSSRK